ncbi:uncharacterized protein LOC119396650 [Rhipicephalus sanguineus]|uniref:uncharacterized protein LOC119396650 n=1 Tax=Rhipicephalus sanguineus TaxID=34632 RepID=UPI0018934721|nr:uncharacterized protein LOC119396650 [Rhipicephalus sanguineus]
MSQDGGDIRNTMLRYWEHFDPSLESMMLDARAQLLNVEESAEILSHLPDISGKDVLELGAGIGRFTSKLAAQARHVTAVDFIPAYVESNRRRNGHLDNVTFLQCDVMKLDRPAESVDVVFSNWLYMYLSDEECMQLLQKEVCWLRDGGLLFLRESCFKPSGDVKRTTNPTFYRRLSDYYNMIKRVSNAAGDTIECFVVENVANVKAYIKHKQNPCQVCFLAKKMRSNAVKDFNSFQEFLDKRQYSSNGVRLYEWIFGDTFISTGGLSTTEWGVKKAGVKDGDRILDVGCGVGGHDFYMAEKFDVRIMAVDLSVNMMSIALEHFAKRPHLADKIQFKMSDVMQAEFPEASFDLIYSRDALLHIADKDTLFALFHKWLAPGGRIFFTDYCRGDKDKEEYSEEFKQYVAQRQYNLLTVSEYGQLLKKAGFVNVKAEDISEDTVSNLRRELERLENSKDEFLKEFTTDDFAYLKQGWEAKIKRGADGDQAWCACYAEKKN